MDDSQPLSILTHRKTHRVRGPRPCSWMSFSSDSSLNDHRDTWPCTIRGSGLSRGSTLRSTTSTESSDSSVSSSTSSSPMNAPKALVERGEKSYYRHARRRKPAGPRASRNSSCFNVRPGLMINTSLSATPQLQRGVSPTTLPIQSADILQSPQIPPFTINSPSNFLLDWDVIFEILLGCSENTSG